MKIRREKTRYIADISPDLQRVKILSIFQSFRKTPHLDFDTIPGDTPSKLDGYVPFYPIDQYSSRKKHVFLDRKQGIRVLHNPEVNKKISLDSPLTHRDDMIILGHTEDLYSSNVDTYNVTDRSERTNIIIIDNNNTNSVTKDEKNKAVTMRRFSRYGGKNVPTTVPSQKTSLHQLQPASPHIVHEPERNYSNPNYSSPNNRKKQSSQTRPRGKSNNVPPHSDQPSHLKRPSAGGDGYDYHRRSKANLGLQNIQGNKMKLKSANHSLNPSSANSPRQLDQAADQSPYANSKVAQKLQLISNFNKTLQYSPITSPGTSSPFDVEANNYRPSNGKKGIAKMDKVIRRKSCCCQWCGGLSALEQKTMHVVAPTKLESYLREERIRKETMSMKIQLAIMKKRKKIYREQSYIFENNHVGDPELKLLSKEKRKRNTSLDKHSDRGDRSGSSSTIPDSSVLKNRSVPRQSIWAPVFQSEPPKDQAEEIPQETESLPMLDKEDDPVPELKQLAQSESKKNFSERSSTFNLELIPLDGQQLTARKSSRKSRPHNQPSLSPISGVSGQKLEHIEDHIEEQYEPKFFYPSSIEPQFQTHSQESADSMRDSQSKQKISNNSGSIQTPLLNNKSKIAMPQVLTKSISVKNIGHHELLLATTRKTQKLNLPSLGASEVLIREPYRYRTSKASGKKSKSHGEKSVKRAVETVYLTKSTTHQKPSATSRLNLKLNLPKINFTDRVEERRSGALDAPKTVKYPRKTKNHSFKQSISNTDRLMHIYARKGQL